MGLLARLGGWALDDGVAPHATAGAYLLGGTPVPAPASTVPAAVGAAFGLQDSSRITRAEAMRRPVVRRARAVVCTTIGSQQLAAHRRLDDQVDDVTAARPLLTQPDPNVTLSYVLTWTVDDLLFYGVSWWRVTDRDPQGYPRHAERLSPERVAVDVARGTVTVDGNPATDAELVRFDGPDEGLLAYGGDVLATSRALDEAVRRFARLEVPQGALKLQQGAPELSDDEVDQLLDDWETSRRTRATAYLNRAVDYQTFQLDAQQSQLAEGRQQQRIDEANLCNVPPRMVNAPQSSSMTYSTTLAERADLVDTTLRGFVVAIEQRLSMPDVTPRGTVVRFDLGQYLSGDPLSALQAAQLAVELGAMTPAEVRTDVLGRTPLPPGALPTPTPEDRP